MNYRELIQERRLFDAAVADGTPELFFSDIGEGLRRGEINRRDISIRALFETFVDDGRELVGLFNPASPNTSVSLQEAAVDTGAFANITGQIFYNHLLEAFENPAFIGPMLTTNIPTQLDGEKIAGISQLGDVAEIVPEAQPFPRAGVSEEWIETPETKKRGLIVPVTKEAIFFDRTALLLSRVADVGQSMGINKEKRILSLVMGVTNTYVRKGVSIDTYGNNSGTHDWDNLVASTALQDWTDIEAALLAFDAITDPNTGEPVVIMPNQILVPSALLMTANRILSATEVRVTTNTSNETLAGNPLAQPGVPSMTPVSNAYVSSVGSSSTTWFVGDFQKAFAYMENWPLTVTQAPVGSQDEFERDIVVQYKASERGVAAVMEPRKVVKLTA